MSEEVGEMEKKATNRPSSVPPKGNGGDANKKTDGNPPRGRFPKQNRKRESPTPNKGRGDLGPPRRSNPQRSKAFDKRPRPRGYYNDRPRDEVAEDEGAEFGSALQVGSKKGNLNHLLNFTYAPRGGEHNYGGAPFSRRNFWNGRNKWSRGGKTYFNKERYLQANCQFVVNESGDYSVYSADPDTLVDWALVEQIRIMSHEVPSCPICLYPPTAAKITRCGHIFCWSCILHYLSLEDKRWRKCPICTEAVNRQCLKSVVAISNRFYNVGDEITMQLMKKVRGATYTMPVSQWSPDNQGPHPLRDEAYGSYIKLLVAKPEQIQHKIINPEKAALLNQLKDNEGDVLETSFITAALKQLESREKDLYGKCTAQREVDAMMEKLALAEKEEKEKEEEVEVQPANTSGANGKKIVEYSSAFSDDEKEEEETPDSGTPPLDEVDRRTISVSSAGSLEAPSSGEPDEHVLPPTGEREELVESTNDGIDEQTAPPGGDDEMQVAPPAENAPDSEIPLDVAVEELSLPEEGATAQGKTDSQKRTEVYYFHQAADGQHIYMHSLNARCLIKEYGSLEACPETITATIVEVESISMTVDLRERLRYLSHLPLTCEFQVVELDLKPPIVSNISLRAFSDVLEKRKRVRQRKLREEKKLTRRCEQEEEKERSKYRSMPTVVHVSSHSVSGGTSDSQSVSSSVSSTTTPIGSPQESSLNPLAAEFNPGGTSPDDGQQSMSFAQMLKAGKSKPMEAWPKARRVSESRDPRALGSDESDNEDRIPVPAFQDSFGSAIQQAFDNMSAEKALEMQSGGKKKKKKGKKLLFSTSMARN